MTSTVVSKQRVFGSAENALVNVSLRYQGFMKVGEVLHLQGPYISLEALQTAVGHLQRRHPFLRSRLQNHPRKLNSYLMEEDITLRLKIREISRKRDEHLSFWQQEWREREKDIPVIGEGLVEFWLLQDPDDHDNDDGRREIVVICEHSICDGISLSTVAHELLLALGEEDKSMFEQSLGWPIIMETAIERSLSRWNRISTLSKFILNGLYWQMTVGRKTVRIPFTNVDFPLNDIHQHSYTEAFYGSLNKEETQKLFEKCRGEGVTVTSAISSAILCALSTLIDDKTAPITYALPADTRRRCSPIVPNHDLSYQISATGPFSIIASEIPSIANGMWELARRFGHHVKTSINKGDILATGMVIGKVYVKDDGPISPTGGPTAGMTNWGPLPFRKEYGSWTLETMTPFGNMTRLPMPMMFVQTVNGVLTIGYVASAPVISANILEKLRDRAMKNLHDMIENQ